MHLWGKLVFTASGNTLSGILQACGIVLPPTTLTALGGGGMIQIEVPSAAWDAPSMPRFQVDGTQTGWNVGSTLSYSYAALVGFTIADPTTAPWPPSIHRHHDDQRRRGGHARGAHGDPAKRRRLHAAAHVDPAAGAR